MMAEPLPDGYLDTGITISVSLGASVSVRLPWSSITINDWDLDTEGVYGGPLSCSPPTPVCMGSKLFLRGQFTGGDILLEEHYHCTSGSGPSPFFPDLMSASYAFAETSGPYRLGVRYRLIDPDNDDAPLFARDYRIEYQWFVDGYTQFQTSLGPKSSGVKYRQFAGGWGSTQHTDLTPQAVSLPSLNFGGGTILNAYTSKTEVCTFTGLSVTGASADASGLDDGYCVGSGSSVIGSYDPSTGIRSGGGSISPSTVLVYDLDVLRNGMESTEALVNTINLGDITVPLKLTRTFRNVSWASSGFGGYEQLSVDSDWAGEQDPPYEDDDLGVRIWAVPAKSDPSADATYTPVTAVLAESLNVLRPDGVTLPDLPSEFVSSDPDIIDVTEGDDSTAFNVSDTGAYVRREFGQEGTDLPIWRRWLGVGASGHADGLFNPDLSQATKHPSETDIFDWSSYSYLRFTIDAPEAASLLLTVEGVQLSIDDPHTTGSDRPDNFSVTETPYSVTYKVPLTGSGIETVDVDLLFPREGGPFYHGRVDAIALEGFTPSVTGYVLSELALVSKLSPDEDGAGTVYLKCGFGPSVQRGDYDALHASHNGAACLAAIGDRVNKTEDFGADGGGLRYVYVLTGAVSATIQDSQLSVGGFWGQLDNIEGWSATYSSAAYEAANKDSFGNTLGPEMAEWTNDLLPHQEGLAGDTFSIAAQPKVGLLIPVAGIPFLIKTRDSKGHGSLEFVTCDDDGVRWEEGLEVQILRTDNGAVVGQAETDAFGYATSTPLPANGELEFVVV